MADAFASFYPQLYGPAFNAEAVVTSDTVDLPNTPRGIYVGTTGDIKVTMVGGQTVTFKSVPVGMLWIRAQRVFASGTTATNLVAVW